MKQFNRALAVALAANPTTNSQALLRGSSDQQDDSLSIQQLHSLESSILTSLRTNSNHRTLQSTNTCMQDLYQSINSVTNTLSCNAQDVKFLAVTGVTVYDPGAYVDENGIWQDACRGADDYVNLSFTANVSIGTERYDVGMYINTEGGSAYTGTCDMSLMSQTDFLLGAVPPETYSVVGGSVMIGELESTNKDECPDVTEDVNGAATLVDYAFAPIRLKCFDTKDAGGNSDGLLDFDIAIAWEQTQNTRYCSPDSTSTWPIPGTTSKCWKAQTRFAVDVHVPPYNTPSAQPSLSTQPSSSPSESFMPSNVPSLKPSSSPSSSPSVSTAPSSSPSSKPSSEPSLSPSKSMAPSDEPSLKPSSRPSEHPSSEPSFTPSNSPSSEPSSSPSASPSDLPSSKPSANPSDVPSSNPSESPSLSAAPTLNTPYPTQSPSVSQEPSTAPTSSPSVSLRPSLSPSESPSAAPSESPTGSLYYPDWINESQVCLNDGADPEYMMQIQKDNYLYHSKEECCRNHFWWRIQQCMGNEKPMYYSNGSYCDQKIYFEDYESKYTPGSWSSSSQFDTLRECCVAKFWYDIEGCIAASPKELTFSFSFTLNNLIEPTNCQDADIQGNALEVAINIGLGSSSSSKVTGIGCATLSNDPETDNTICGGCLAGSYLGEDYSNTRDGAYYSNTASATVTVDVSTKSSNCQDSVCFQTIYNSIISEFTDYVNNNGLTAEIVAWAAARVPPIPELWNADVVTSSLTTSGTYSDPFNDPDGVISATTITSLGTLSVDGLPTITTSAEQQKANAIFETAIAGALEEQGALPDGAIVTVTGLGSGTVQYKVTLSASSSTDANTAVSQINTSLSQTTTLEAITAIVQTESAGGSLSMTSLSVNSSTAGSSTETEAIVATSTGQFTTSISTSGMSSTEIDEVETYFEDAITQKVQSEGLLPEGSFVTVIGIDSSGVVSYEVKLFTDPNDDVGSITASINSVLSQPSTLSDIQDAVTSDSTGIIDGASLTTAGKLSVTGLSITTSQQMTDATNYFTTAIETALEEQGALPAGAVVTVTGFGSGTVEYEIIVSGDSGAEVSQAISQINTSLSHSTTQTLIKDIAVSKSLGGTLSLTSFAVNSNTAGTSTETTVVKVTTTGQLTTSVKTVGLSSAEVDEVANIMEVSITAELDAQGVLPDGSYVTVTGIDSSGVVSYIVTMYNDPAADSRSLVTAIETTLSSSTSRTAIQNTAIAESSGSSISASVTTALSSLSVSSFTAGYSTGIANSGSVATALSVLSISGFTAGTTTGVPDNKWYPQFDQEKKGCSNDGFEHSYMKENESYYMFSTKKECCDTWFSYDPYCFSSSLTKEKFYPDFSSGVCGKKQEKEFESYEVERYNTLEECCSTFAYSYSQCCDTPGLGGCALTGVVVYVPDWFQSECYAKSETALLDHEDVVSYSTASECCGTLFGWRKSQCCRAAGGC